jgi:hypothetical protein
VNSHRQLFTRLIDLDGQQDSDERSRVSQSREVTQVPIARFTKRFWFV